MNTKILEYIIAIAEEKSISQAADRFYLSQPVLSRHLKKIEDELGAPLSSAVSPISLLRTPELSLLTTRRRFCTLRNR